MSMVGAFSEAKAGSKQFPFPVVPFMAPPVCPKNLEADNSNVPSQG